MTINTKFNDVLERYSNMHGVRIDMGSGAVVLETLNEDIIWLEAPVENSLVLFHINLLNRVSVSCNLHKMERLLKENGDAGNMQGAWLCIHEPTDTLRLCTSMPKSYIDLELLDSCISNLSSLARNRLNIH